MKQYLLLFITLSASILAAEPPYKEGELRDRYVLTDSQLRSSVSDIKRLMGIKRQPKRRANGVRPSVFEKLSNPA